MRTVARSLDQRGLDRAMRGGQSRYVTAQCLERRIRAAEQADGDGRIRDQVERIAKLFRLPSRAFRDRLEARQIGIAVRMRRDHAGGARAQCRQPAANVGDAGLLPGQRSHRDFASIVSTSSGNCALIAAVGGAMLATSASLPSVSVVPSQMEAAITAPVLRHTAGATRTFTHSGRSWNEQMVINVRIRRQCSCSRQLARRNSPSAALFR